MAKWLILGARREGRTPTLLREPDFESGASASSAIRAYPHLLSSADVFLACRRQRVNRHQPTCRSPLRQPVTIDV